MSQAHAWYRNFYKCRNMFVSNVYDFTVIFWGAGCGGVKESYTVRECFKSVTPKPDHFQTLTKWFLCLLPNQTNCTQPNNCHQVLIQILLNRDWFVTISDISLPKTSPTHSEPMPRACKHTNHSFHVPKTEHWPILFFLLDLITPNTESCRLQEFRGPSPRHSMNQLPFFPFLSSLLHPSTTPPTNPVNKQKSHYL